MLRCPRARVQLLPSFRPMNLTAQAIRAACPGARLRRGWPAPCWRTGSPPRPASPAGDVEPGGEIPVLAVDGLLPALATGGDALLGDGPAGGDREAGLRTGEVAWQDMRGGEIDRCVCMSSQGARTADEAVKVGPAKGARYRPRSESRFPPRLHPSPGQEMDGRSVCVRSGSANCKLSGKGRTGKRRAISTSGKEPFCRGWSVDVWAVRRCLRRGVAINRGAAS